MEDIFVQEIFCLTKNLNKADIIRENSSCGRCPLLSLRILLVVHESPAQNHIRIKAARICLQLVLTDLNGPCIASVQPLFSGVRLSLCKNG